MERAPASAFSPRRWLTRVVASALAGSVLTITAWAALDTADDKPVELKAKWRVGERQVHRATSRQEQKIILQAMPEPINQVTTQQQVFAVTVVQERPEGGYELEVTFLRFVMDSGLGGPMAMKFDSESDPKDDASNPLAAVLRAVSKGKFRIFTLASGKLDRVEGLKEILDQASANLPEMGRGMAKTVFNEDLVRQMGLIPQGLPEKPVKVGDEWPFKQEISLGPLGNVQIGMTMTFSGWEDREGRRCAIIDHKGYLSAKPGTATGETMSISALSGDTKGRAWFDPALGVMIDSTSLQNVKTKMKAMGQDTTITSVANSTNQVTEVIAASK